MRDGSGTKIWSPVFWRTQADEPTGALDSQTSRVVMDLFHELHEKYHKTIVLITHNPELAEECQRVLTLRDGLIVGERKGTGERAAF